MGHERGDILVVIVTASNQEDANKIAETVISSRHAACATTVPVVHSLYWWEGKMVRDQESMVIFKTTTDKYETLQETIKAVHSYKVPEIIAVPVSIGLPQYLEWVRTETTMNRERK